METQWPVNMTFDLALHCFCRDASLPPARVIKPILIHAMSPLKALYAIKELMLLPVVEVLTNKTAGVTGLGLGTFTPHEPSLWLIAGTGNNKIVIATKGGFTGSEPGKPGTVWPQIDKYEELRAERDVLENPTTAAGMITQLKPLGTTMYDSFASKNLSAIASRKEGYHLGWRDALVHAGEFVRDNKIGLPGTDSSQ